MNRSLKNATISKELERTEPIFNVPEYSWYPKTEYCFMSNNKGLFVAAKGGYNQENHNHNDVGSFMFYINSTPIFIDTGVGSYTAKTFGPNRYSIWTMQSDYHNLPLINNIAQRPGAIFKATNTNFNKKKKIFSTDISKAYPERAAVKSWLRSYQLQNDGLVIKDKFSLSKATVANKINFMTWGDISLKTSGKVIIKVNEEIVELVYNKEQLKATLEPIELKEKKLSRVWGDTIYRLSFIAKSLSKEGEYIFRIKNID